MFARKIIRPLGLKVTKEDIAKEAIAISTLSKAGRNKNIVSVFKHGWLPHQSDTYYIDMEYCVTTLHARIQEGVLSDETSPQDRGSSNNTVVEAQAPQNQGVDQESDKGPFEITDEDVSSNSSLAAGIDWKSVLDIIEDICSGLIYLHDQDTVHRDLKPWNGTLILTLLIYLVLLSDNDQCWKLADFGTASQATSKRLNTTRDGRGTQGYRAPEIFKARYNKRSDIFALGCIVYEVVTGAKLFAEDHAVRCYMDSGKLPEATWWPPPAAGKTCRLLYLERLLASMLELDFSNRPNAHQVLESLRIIRAGEFAQSEVLLTGDDTLPIQAFPVYSPRLRFRDSCPIISCGRRFIAKPLL